MDYRNSMKLKINMNIGSDYSFGKKLGKGNFGTVSVGVHRRTKVQCAIKTIDKVALQNKGDERLFNLLKGEIEVL